jgi:2,4-dienoyl-CoA reductase-like NADH-dependent reductase (Old Yellow Enzyme family)
MSSALFSATAIGPLALANRVVVSPMCQYSAAGGAPTAWHRQHLGWLATTGAGLVIVEATAATPEGRITHGCTGLWNDAQEAAFNAIVTEMRAVGAGAVGIQLAHAGRKASAQRPWEGGGPLGPDQRPWPTRAPSALANDAGWHVPEAFDAAGIAGLARDFAAAARRAERAGFDLVELHAAHGYLLHQFMTPFANRRDDEWGGTKEKRMRAPLEVAAAVRAAWPRSRALGARITGTDWLEGGLTVEDAVGFAARLKEIGYDYVCVSSGGIAGAKIALGPGYHVPFAERVRRDARISTMAVGLIVDPRLAEAIVREGRADTVALARGFLDDPRWAWRAAELLGAPAPVPVQYARSRPGIWPGAAMKAA